MGLGGAWKPAPWLVEAPWQRFSSLRAHAHCLLPGPGWGHMLPGPPGLCPLTSAAPAGSCGCWVVCGVWASAGRVVVGGHGPLWAWGEGRQFLCIPAHSPGSQALPFPPWGLFLPHGALHPRAPVQLRAHGYSSAHMHSHVNTHTNAHMHAHMLTCHHARVNITPTFAQCSHTLL